MGFVNKTLYFVTVFKVKLNNHTELLNVYFFFLIYFFSIQIERICFFFVNWYLRFIER